MKIRKLIGTVGLMAGLTLGLAQSAWSQAYPSAPVRMIVAFGPGSGTDVIARYLADALSRRMNQSFVVENRVGASGNIGMSAGAKSNADGYTLVLGGLGVNAMNQFLFPAGTLGFDPEKDFETVILVAKLPFLLAVSPSFPANSFAELVAMAKAKPGSVNTAITTTTSRMVMEEINKYAGIQLFPVAYKAPATAIVDVIAGRVQVSIETAASLRPHVASGNLKPLALTSKTSSDVLPGVKAAAEQGLPNFEFVGWVSMYMPKGAPRAAINTINAEINKILALPETKKRFLELGMEAGSGSPQDMADFERSERNRWGPVIKAANLKAE
jgi:tripartite-type tricarboxylate transporter receptor subunit TctC